MNIIEDAFIVALKDESKCRQIIRALLSDPNASKVLTSSGYDFEDDFFCFR